MITASHAYIKIGLLAWSLVWHTSSVTATAPRPPRYFKEVGGSNYVMYDVHREYLEGNGDAWFKPGVLQPVVASFHHQNKDTIRAQLRAMHASGQRKIAVLVWHNHLAPRQIQADGVHGHVVASNGGHLLSQHEENLKGLLALIRQDHLFDELIFRFAPQGQSYPSTWTTWEEELFRENMDFIVSVRALVNKALDASGIKVLFDLGAELGGIEKDHTTEYTRRVWAEYARRFGTHDSVGFSIATHPGRVARWIGVCDRVGVRPARFALDIYDHIPQWMPLAISELRAAGINQPSLIVLETYHNDPQSLKELQAVAEEHGIEYLYLMQWPYKRGAKMPHFSDVFHSQLYDAYLVPR